MSAAAETVARLKRRVYRAPASLGGYHYYLEVGQVVYITGHAGGVPRCTTIAERADRYSEDYFSVAYADLEVVERANLETVEAVLDHIASGAALVEARLLFADGREL